MFRTHHLFHSYLQPLSAVDAVSLVGSVKLSCAQIKQKRQNECCCVSPELHSAVDQSQGDEVLLVVLTVVQQDACHLGRPKLHGDAQCVVCTHSVEGQE